LILPSCSTALHLLSFRHAVAEGAVMFQGSRHGGDRTTADAWLLAAAQGLAVLNLHIWLRLMLS
jgi:hypothetical protein